MSDIYKIKTPSNRIVSGIARKYIISFFEKYSVRMEDETFFGPADMWRVHIGPEQKKNVFVDLGFTTTILQFAGEQKSVEEIIYKYRLEFISAGA